MSSGDTVVDGVGFCVLVTEVIEGHNGVGGEATLDELVLLNVGPGADLGVCVIILGDDELDEGDVVAVRLAFVVLHALDVGDVKHDAVM